MPEPDRDQLPLRQDLMSGRNQVLLAVGSNIEPRKNIQRVRQILAERFVLRAESSWIKTAPDGYQDQDDFLNGAFLIETELDRRALKKILRSIEEDDLGRVRGPIKSGPRTMDLDIIVWNGSVVDNDYYKKYYIKKPINEICQVCQLQLKEQAG